jgi:hypothetical protein
LSAPTLRGDNGTLPIGFGVSTYSSVAGLFEPFKGKFNCDLSNPAFPIQPEFFNRSLVLPPLPPPQVTQTTPSAPLWIGAGGTEVSAIAEGAQTIQSIVKYIQFQVLPGNERFPEKLFVAPTANAWSNNGVAGIVNPNNGIPYIVWNCHPDAGDTCKPESTGKINIFKIVDPFLNRGEHRGCADWSIYNPAVTFFQGKIWIAWRGNESGQTGYINIASLDPF